jgi:hypothetical protein
MGCTPDVSQFEGLVTLGAPADYVAADTLKSIAEKVQK